MRKRSNLEREAIENNLAATRELINAVIGRRYYIMFCELTPEMLKMYFTPDERRDFDLDERTEVVCIWGNEYRTLLHVIDTSGLNILGILAAVLERMAAEEEY